MPNKKRISIEEVEHISQMARIDLTQEEKQKFSKELSNVLEYVEQLQEVDTENVTPISQVTGAVNVFREDVSEDCDKETKEKMIENFPDRDGIYIKTKRVL